MTDALSEPPGDGAVNAGCDEELSPVAVPGGSLNAPAQLSLLPEWDGRLPVPYGVIPF